MRFVCFLVYSCSSTSISIKSVSFLLACWCWLEWALLEIEINRIEREEFTHKNILDILFIIKSVSKKKAPLFHRVSVKVKVKIKFLDWVKILDVFFWSPNRGLPILIWAKIESIKILPSRIKSIISSRNSIRVQNRYDLKHIVFQKSRSLFLWGKNEI